MTYITIQTCKWILIIFALIHVSIASIVWDSPPSRATHRGDPLNEPYFCGNQDKIAQNRLPTIREEQNQLFWVENNTDNQGFPIKFRYRHEVKAENYTVMIWRVQWDQDLSNDTLVLSPILKGRPVLVYSPETKATRGKLIFKNDLNSNPYTMNVTFTTSHVCRPETFQCSLVLEKEVLIQNRTGRGLTKTWTSCADVKIFSHIFDIDIEVTIRNPSELDEVPPLVESLENRFYTRYKDDGFTRKNAKRIYPGPDVKEFPITKDIYKIRFRISDSLGLNSDTVAKAVVENVKVDPGMHIEVKTAQILGRANRVNGNSKLKLGLGWLIPIFIVSYIM